MKSLKAYNSKRNFKKTKEPKGKIQSISQAPRFCIQEHHARRLHYDFRLEYKGVLLSWAVPKGPSLNPKDKRLAIKVEDHPLQYQYFEGTIPKGNYGAGTVEIWDAGTFHIHGSKDLKEIEKALTQGLKKGHFNVILTGEKLNGEFIFQKLKKDPDDQAWLLIKKKDDYSAEKEVIKKVKMPSFCSPMLAKLIDKPFDGDEWLFEIKWDGFRSLAFIDNRKVELLSRTNHSWNNQFTSISDDLKKIKSSCILDGELVVLDKEGKSSFQLMQNFQNEKVGTLCYYVFDLLFKDGEDLKTTPLITRKELLKKLLHESDLKQVRFSDHILKDGIAFFKEASKKQLEGIIGKKISSAYQSKRSSDWVKIKTSFRQEVVIGGFTEPRGTRQKFGALLIGIYKDNRFEYVGHVGSGFSEKALLEVYKLLKTRTQDTCPFHHTPKTNEPATWIKPNLVCEVSFTEWTKDESMRHPIFEGIRADKDPKTIIKEIPEKAPKIGKTIKKRNLQLTHLEKIYWEEEGYTKGDLIAYYESIAKVILPYLKNRPIMLHRYPNGIAGTEFYQKDLSTHPDWVKTCLIKQEKKLNHYLLINDLDSLLYAVNLGSIDLHPFLAQVKSLDSPNICVIDLDPHDISFDKVIEVALIFHHLLEKIKVPHFCKTSGGKGLHILIPLKKGYTFDQSRQFAEIIAQFVHKQMPKETSLERSLAKRPNQIYLDCLQNRVSQSIVSPYSVRPRPHARVSAPLSWDEVKIGLCPSDFTLLNMAARLKKKGDLLLPLLKETTNLEKTMKDLNHYIAAQVGED